MRERLRTARHGRAEVDPSTHNTAAAMDAFFAEVADETPYVEFATALRTVLDGHGVLLDGRHIIDVGVGPGLMLAALLSGRRAGSVTGVDFSGAALAHAAKAIPGGMFRQHDIYELLGGRYDIVLCTEVLEHLRHPARAMRTLLDALEPDGTLVLTVPDGRVDFSRYHVNFWSPESWQVFVGETAPDHEAVLDTFRVRETAYYKNNLAIVRGRS